MKKIAPFGFLVLSIGIFLGYSSYIQGPFDYHVAQFIGYLFYWSAALFIVSLFATILDTRKYKTWLLVTSIYVLISILIAWGTGDGNGAIISFDGKDLTWFFAGLYSIVSIVYFIAHYFERRK